MDFVCKNKLLVLLALVILTSCQNQIGIEFPDVGIEQDELNHELEIINLIPENYRINEPIRLMVRLRSNIEVFSKNDFGARMFILNRESGQWEEVYDPVKSYSEELNLDLNDIFEGTDEIVLSTKDNSKLDQRAITLHPVLESDNNSIRMLIVVSGYIYENEAITSQKVGAYTIITLKR